MLTDGMLGESQDRVDRRRFSARQKNVSQTRCVWDRTVAADLANDVVHWSEGLVRHGVV